MSTERSTRLLREVAEREVAPDVDLWPAIHARVQIKPRGRSRTPLLALGVALLVIVGVFVVTAPPTQAAQAVVQGWLQRAGIILIPPPVPRPTPAPAGAPRAQARPVSTGTATRVAYVGVAEAQRRVAFPIRLAGWLPPRLVMEGAAAGPGSPADGGQKAASVIVRYQLPANAEGDIAIRETTGHRQGGYAFPAAGPEDVTVNGHPATYVHGSYHGDGQWDSNVDVSTMSWDADGITYVLSSEGLGLSRADLLRVANSIR
jgi:hypothetical protein